SSSRRRHTRSNRDWSSDVCSSDLRMPRCWGSTASATGARWSWHPEPSATPGSCGSEATRPSTWTCPSCCSGEEESNAAHWSFVRSEERRVGRERVTLVGRDLWEQY